jgi:flagellar biosynthetic protein FlhB
MSQERTEKPTAKRLSDAHEKGDVARSRDLALAAASVATTVALAKLGGRLVSGMADHLAFRLEHFGDAPLRDLAAGDIASIAVQGSWLIAVLVGPIGTVAMVVGVFMHGMQGGWVFAPTKLQFDWNRLNPANGIKRFGMMQSGMETLKTMVSVAVIVWLGWRIVATLIQQAPQLAWLTPFGAAALAWSHTDTLLWRVAWALGFLALGDYALQKYRLTKSLKMTKQEVKDEYKQSQGSPENKRRVRKAQVTMARRRMMRDVARATVVITNPTHFAVALEYRRETMAAPVVLAKGADAVAMRIREEARSHGIPIIENKPLAQALYHTAEIGQVIPSPLFGAVAEVLAYLVRIKQLML